MKTADLSNYNLAELKRLQEDIAREIKSSQQQEVQKAREQILAIAQSTGLSISELLAGNEKKANKSTGQKVAAQYQNPADNLSTWTGRGRQPKWVVEALTSGKTLDDLRVAK